MVTLKDDFKKFKHHTGISFSVYSVDKPKCWTDKKKFSEMKQKPASMEFENVSGVDQKNFVLILKKFQINLKNLNKILEILRNIYVIKFFRRFANKYQYDFESVFLTQKKKNFCKNKADENATGFWKYFEEILSKF